MMEIKTQEKYKGITRKKFILAQIVYTFIGIGNLLLLFLGIYTNLVALIVACCVLEAVFIFGRIHSLSRANVVYSFDEQGVVEINKDKAERIYWYDIKFIGVKKEVIKAFGLFIVIAQGGNESVLEAGQWYRPEHKAFVISATREKIEAIKKYWHKPILNEDVFYKFEAKRGKQE